MNDWIDLGGKHSQEFFKLYSGRLARERMKIITGLDYTPDLRVLVFPAIVPPIEYSMDKKFVNLVNKFKDDLAFLCEKLSRGSTLYLRPLSPEVVDLFCKGINNSALTRYSNVKSEYGSPRWGVGPKVSETNGLMYPWGNDGFTRDFNEITNIPAISTKVPSLDFVIPTYTIKDYLNRGDRSIYVAPIYISNRTPYTNE